MELDYQIVERENVAPGDTVFVQVQKGSSYRRNVSGDCLAVGMTTLTLNIAGDAEVFNKFEIVEVRRSWLDLI